MSSLNRMRQRSEGKRLPSPYPPLQADETTATLHLKTTTISTLHDRTLKLSKHFNLLYI